VGQLDVEVGNRLACIDNLGDVVRKLWRLEVRATFPVKGPVRREPMRVGDVPQLPRVWFRKELCWHRIPSNPLEVIVYNVIVLDDVISGNEANLVR